MAGDGTPDEQGIEGTADDEDTADADDDAAEDAPLDAGTADEADAD